MKNMIIYCLLAIMFILTGCPVLTKNSIDNGSYDVPSWLPGKWQEVTAKEHNKDIYFIQKDDKKGNLKCYDADSTGSINNSSVRQMIMSTVGTKTFICVYNPGDDLSDQGYYIYEFRKVSDHEIALYGIKDKALPYSATQNEIIKFLEDNKDKDIYDPAETVHYRKL